MYLSEGTWWNKVIVMANRADCHPPFPCIGRLIPLTDCLPQWLLAAVFLAWGPVWLSEGVLIINCEQQWSSLSLYRQFLFKAKQFKTIKVLSRRLEHAVFVQINYSFELLLFKLICHSNIYLLHWQNVNSMFNSCWEVKENIFLCFPAFTSQKIRGIFIMNARMRLIMNAFVH